MTSPPGESTFKITALTESSSAARSSCALTTSTMLLPAESGEWLVMMPSTLMTAILLCESLSSRIHSSSFGPTWRALTVLKPWLKLNERTANWPRMIIPAKPSSNARMMDVMIQPQLRRGLGAGGGAMNGGVAGGGGPPMGAEKFGLSIGAETNPKRAGRQAVELHKLAAARISIFSGTTGLARDGGRVQKSQGEMPVRDAARDGEKTLGHGRRPPGAQGRLGKTAVESQQAIAVPALISP